MKLPIDILDLSKYVFTFGYNDGRCSFKDCIDSAREVSERFTGSTNCDRNIWSYQCSPPCLSKSSEEPKKSINLIIPKPMRTCTLITITITICHQTVKTGMAIDTLVSLTIIAGTLPDDATLFVPENQVTFLLLSLLSENQYLLLVILFRKQ